MSQIPDEILEHIFSYLTNNRDRNTVSLVCKSWYEVEKHSRTSVLIGNCYALSPERLIRRFPAVKSLTIKGRLGDFDWAPREWGGSVEPWVLALAAKCPDLRELRLKRMVVSDQNLALISTAFWNFKSLVLISCLGFSTIGLGAIAANCRFLEHLDLLKCEAGDDDGKWLSCFPESFTSLVSLNFACLREKVNLVDLERLVARCPNLRNLRLNNLVPLTTLQKIAMLAPQLVEVEMGPHVFRRDIIQPTQTYTRLLEAIRSWKSIRSLCISGFQFSVLCLSPIPSICSKLVSLDMSSLVPYHDSALVKIIENCHQLQRLWVLDLIGDKGLLVVASTCKELRDLRLFQAFSPRRVNFSVTEAGLVAISKGCPLLHSLQFLCHRMTNAALITLSKNCPNITCFTLGICEPKKPDHVTFQPLDEGFGAIVQSCKGLRRLALSGLLTDLVFLYIGMYAEQLEVLSAAFAGDSDRGMLYALNGCRNLRKLEFTDCPFGDTALLANVARYETMRCLYMSGCKVTLGGCKFLAKEMPSLKVEVINRQNLVRDYPDDRKKVKGLYVYRTLDGPRNDAPELVWTV